jgi:hypothetical protein
MDTKNEIKFMVKFIINFIIIVALGTFSYIFFSAEYIGDKVFFIEPEYMPIAVGTTLLVISIVYFIFFMIWYNKELDKVSRFKK